MSSALLLVAIVSMPHHLDCPELYVETVSSPPYGVLITEFYPCGLCNDEYVVLSSLQNWGINLLGWSLSDGEGTIQFLTDEMLPSLGSVTISWNSTSFSAAFGRLPTISMDASGTSPRVGSNGTFRLADSGDTLALYSPPGDLVDFVCFGDSNATGLGWTGIPIPGIGRGEVVKRSTANGCYRDTDSLSDWCQFREFRYGYTEWGRTTFNVGAGNVTTFVSPDCSLDVVLGAIEGAKARISICTYEFSSVPIATSLLRAMNRGLEVLLVVDGSPAGGMSLDQVSCLSVLSKYGIDVRTIKGNASDRIVQHIGAVHAKFIVVDTLVTIVSSENLVSQGFPSDRLYANRGWGLLVRSSDLSRYVEGIVLEDGRTTRADVIPWALDPRNNRLATLPDFPKANHTRGMLNPLTINTPSSVTVLPSPDSSVSEAYLCDLIGTARYILAEQFQADLMWEKRWSESKRVSPVMTAIIGKIKAGGSAEVLFDSSWFNIERNDAVIAMLSENSSSFGSAGQFRLLDQRSPIATLHNKGAVFDERFVLVSSNNWVCASFSKNRELGLLLDSREAAGYFSEAFDLDWVPDRTAPIADAGPDVEVLVGERVLLDSDNSYDDRAVSDVSWDIDGDARGESSNDSFEFVGLVPGSYHVILTVEDAWGNRASDEAVIHVIAPGGATSEGSSKANSLSWTLPLIVGGAILLARYRQSRKRGGHPRKVNHGPCS